MISDTHGNLEIWRKLNPEELLKKGFLVILGDMIHRGRPEENEEIMRDILGLREKYGERLVYLAGNHELPYMYEKAKKTMPGDETLDIGKEGGVSKETYEKFRKFIKEDGALIAKTRDTIFIHGGPAPEFSKLADIRDENPDMVKLAEEFVWNDAYPNAQVVFFSMPPQPYKNYKYIRSRRGRFYTPRALEEFLEKAGAKRMICGHKHENDEPFDKNGFEEKHRKMLLRVVTGAGARKGFEHAYIELRPDGRIVRHELRGQDV